MSLGKVTSPYWFRRVIVGKNEQEEQAEEQNFPRMNKAKKELRRLLAEFVGTFVLVFFIVASQMEQDYSNTKRLSPLYNVDKGLIGGLVLIGLIYTFGRVSGAHFNPIISMAFFLRGIFRWTRAIAYIICQFLGALLAGAVVYSIYDTVGTTIPTSQSTKALGMEIVMSFTLVLVVLSTASKSRLLGATSGIAVGLTLSAILMLAWNFSGASANPWRTLGPMIVANEGWSTIWVYIAGPIIGMVLATFLHRIFTTAVIPSEAREHAKGIAKDTSSNV
eukprot:TRINITY_DN17861_c0_g1_i1.p1 TRINITY_DN17861_c0_g1~~TRINITY_DN17861_c0_g1_i1.p1  ORF type:complete len:277 (+),score=10.69 TRINITY_DN17861_c0_g1_i1:69-899(+)